MKYSNRDVAPVPLWLLVIVGAHLFVAYIVVSMLLGVVMASISALFMPQSVQQSGFFPWLQLFLLFATPLAWCHDYESRPIFRRVRQWPLRIQNIYRMGLLVELLASQSEYGGAVIYITPTQIQGAPVRAEHVTRSLTVDEAV